MRRISNATWVLLALLLVAGGVGWAVQQCAALLFSASFQDAYFDPASGRLVVLTAVEAREADGIRNIRSDWAAHLVDLETGRRVARIDWGPGWHAIGVTRNVFWIFDEPTGRLIGLDLLKLRRRLELGPPQLVLAQDAGYVASSDGCCLLATDGAGRRLRIDGTTAAIGPARDDARGESLGAPVDPQPAALLSGSLRATFEAPAATLRVGDRALAGPPFLGGRFLMRTPDQALEEGGALFVVHLDSLAAKGAPLVSRVSWSSGEIGWTTRLPGETRPRAGFLWRGILALLGRTEEGVASLVGLAAQTGEIRWRLALRR